MKLSHPLLIVTALSPVLTLAARAQNSSAPPPPLPSAVAQSSTGTAATYNSRISAVVYGPQGEIQALTLRNGFAVSLPPDLGTQLQTAVARGSRVQVSGTQRVIAGQTSLLAQSLTANGQTVIASQPPAPTADPGGAAAAALPPPPPGLPGPRGPAARPAPGGPAPPPPPPPPADATPAPAPQR